MTRSQLTLMLPVFPQLPQRVLVLIPLPVLVLHSEQGHRGLLEPYIVFQSKPEPLLDGGPYIVLRGIAGLCYEESVSI